LPLSDQAIAAVVLPGGLKFSMWNNTIGSLSHYEHLGGVTYSSGKEWVAASRYLDGEIAIASRATGQPRLAVFAFNDYMININTVLLDAEIRNRALPELAVISPIPGYNGTAKYLTQLKPMDPSVTVVVTVTSLSDEFVPPVPLAVGTDYVSTLHFKEFARYQLPDGAGLIIWARR
jgi:hypothetical protein